MIDECLQPLEPSPMKWWGHYYLVKDTKELLPCIHCGTDSSLRPQLHKFQSDFDYPKQPLHVWGFLLCETHQAVLNDIRRKHQIIFK